MAQADSGGRNMLGEGHRTTTVFHDHVADHDHVIAKGGGLDATQAHVAAHFDGACHTDRNAHVGQRQMVFNNQGTRPGETLRPCRREAFDGDGVPWPVAKVDVLLAEQADGAGLDRALKQQCGAASRRQQRADGGGSGESGVGDRIEGQVAGDGLQIADRCLSAHVQGRQSTGVDAGGGDILMERDRLPVTDPQHPSHRDIGVKGGRTHTFRGHSATHYGGGGEVHGGGNVDQTNILADRQSTADRQAVQVIGGEPVGLQGAGEHDAPLAVQGDRGGVHRPDKRVVAPHRGICGGVDHHVPVHREAGQVDVGQAVQLHSPSHRGGTGHGEGGQVRQVEIGVHIQVAIDGQAGQVGGCKGAAGGGQSGQCNLILAGKGDAGGTDIPVKAVVPGHQGIDVGMNGQGAVQGEGTQGGRGEAVHFRVAGQRGCGVHSHRVDVAQGHIATEVEAGRDGQFGQSGRRKAVGRQMLSGGADTNAVLVGHVDLSGTEPATEGDQAAAVFDGQGIGKSVVQAERNITAEGGRIHIIQGQAAAQPGQAGHAERIDPRQAQIPAKNQVAVQHQAGKIGDGHVAAHGDGAAQAEIAHLV